MGELMPQGNNSESFLLICTYCDKHRNDAGYWDLIFDSYGKISGACISYGICPECLQVGFLSEYASCCEEGSVVMNDRRCSE